MLPHQHPTHPIQTPQRPIVLIISCHHIAEIVFGVFEISCAPEGKQNLSQSDEIVVVPGVDGDELLVAEGGFVEVGGLEVEGGDLLPGLDVAGVALDVGV